MKVVASVWVVGWEKSFGWKWIQRARMSQHLCVRPEAIGLPRLDDQLEHVIFRGVFRFLEPCDQRR
jgi:hypothetical protein